MRRLEETDADTWCDLCLWARAAKGEAIAAGAGFAGAAVEVYRAFLPPCDAATVGGPAQG